MPIYEYECGKCSHRFEMRQGFDDEPQAMCPQCQGRAKRVFHAAPIIFKGKGFYVTDHRNSPGPEASPSKPEASSSKSEVS